MVWYLLELLQCVCFDDAHSCHRSDSDLETEGVTGSKGSAFRRSRCMWLCWHHTNVLARHMR
eukprot:852883-Amphidinium_carterae.1